MSELTVERDPSRRPDPSVAPQASAVVLPGDATGDPAAAPGVAITVVRQERRGERTVGVFELVHDRVSWRPVVDVERIVERSQATAVAVAAAVAAVAISRAWSRSRPEVGRVTMGPGGWLSVRGDSRRAVNVNRGHRRRGPAAPGHRPWWARLLRARRIS